MSLFHFRLIGMVFRRIREKIELRGYTPLTIAGYLRKQGAQIGEDCTIFPTSLGTEPYLVKLGNRVAIADDVAFIPHDGGAAVLRAEIPNIQVFGPIVIEDNCVIGQGVIIFGNTRIGTNSIIGAGSVVITDIPPNTIAMGIPARPFGSVSKYREKCIERWTIQQPPDIEIEPGATWWNSRHFEANRERLKKHLLKLFEKELSS
jgi:acetyltransferase-like isoleucine patch superfamily enzyme